MKSSKIRISSSVRTGKKTGISANRVGLKKVIPSTKNRIKVK